MTAIHKSELPSFQHTHDTEAELPEQKPVRSAWRQRWVDTERGWTHSFRSESTFFVHFFIASLVTCTGVVVGIRWLEWSILVMCFAMVMSAEMFQCALRRIVKILALDSTHQVANSTTGVSSFGIYNPGEITTRDSPTSEAIDQTTQHCADAAAANLLIELTRIGTAAVMTASLGSCLTTCLIFLDHLLKWLRTEELLTWLN